MRCITWRAVHVGNRERISAARPVTTGAAKLVPNSGVEPCCPATALTNPPPVELSDTTPSPGAATSTHGPAMVNADASPRMFTDPTVSTESSYQAGITDTVAD